MYEEERRRQPGDIQPALRAVLLEKDDFIGKIEYNIIA
jgi:hypothetical protein